jgi:hypothetical protein
MVGRFTKHNLYFSVNVMCFVGEGGIFCFLARRFSGARTEENRFPKISIDFNRFPSISIDFNISISKELSCHVHSRYPIDGLELRHPPNTIGMQAILHSCFFKSNR